MILPHNRSVSRIIDTKERLTSLARSGQKENSNKALGEKVIDEVREGRSGATRVADLTRREMAKRRTNRQVKSTVEKLKKGKKNVARTAEKEVSKKAKAAAGKSAKTSAKIKGLARDTAKKGKQAKKTAKGAKRATKAVKKSIQTVAITAKSVTAALTGASAVLPVILPLLLAVLIIASVVSIIPAISTTITLKNEDLELTKTYTYITELDVAIEEELRSVTLSRPGYDEYDFFINGEACGSQVRIQTDTDRFLAYLDTKYDAYTLDGILRIFGVKVRTEIGKIHGDLYKIRYIPKQESIPRTDGNPPDIKHILEVRLTVIEFGEYLEKRGLLTDEEKERYDILQEIGIYTARQELGDPFAGSETRWKDSMTDRFGWRHHPITGEKQLHQGIDIAMPQGTPITSVVYGSVVLVKENENYGKYVEIESIDGEKHILFAHCSEIIVSPGQSIARGEIIAYVGSTGQTNGAHLHIEYTKKGHQLNPLFYLRG